MFGLSSSAWAPEIWSEKHDLIIEPSSSVHRFMCFNFPVFPGLESWSAWRKVLRLNFKSKWPRLKQFVGRNLRTFAYVPKENDTGLIVNSPLSDRLNLVDASCVSAAIMSCQRASRWSVALGLHHEAPQNQQSFDSTTNQIFNMLGVCFQKSLVTKVPASSFVNMRCFCALQTFNQLLDLAVFVGEDGDMEITIGESADSWISENAENLGLIKIWDAWMDWLQLIRSS